MKFIVFFLMIFQILFLSSCSKRTSNIDLVAASALMQTKKIYFKNEPNLVFVFTYINALLEKERDKELFLMSVSPRDAILKDISFNIDGQKPIIKELSKYDELLKYAVKNEFSKEFSLEIPLQKQGTLRLELCLKAICQQLSFQKYSKSLYYRSINLDTQYN